MANAIKQRNTSLTVKSDKPVSSREGSLLSFDVALHFNVEHFYTPGYALFTQEQLSNPAMTGWNKIMLMSPD